MIGIYCIESKASGKVYVGQSVNVISRIADHKRQLSSGCHKNRHLQSAYMKYGLDSFSFRVLRECTVEELDVWERIYIRHFNSMESGYNLDSGGGSNRVRSEETRRKLSEVNKGKKQSEESKRKTSEKLKGRKRPESVIEKLRQIMKGTNRRGFGWHHSEETRQKISNSNKGRVVSEEVKRKHSEFMKGNKHMLGKKPGPLSEEGRRKISETHKGNKYRQGKFLTEETLKKISDALKGRAFTDEHKRKIGEANRRRVVSPETKEKISKSVKKYMLTRGKGS